MKFKGKRLCENYKLQKSIVGICKDEYKYFLNKCNVIGVGCGYKVTGSFRTCDLCIQVFVVKKIPKCKLAFRDMIPRLFKGIKTDVIQTSNFTACGLTTKIRPVLGGYSISARDSQEFYGTAGCLVTNGVSKFLLGTNHTLVNLNTKPIGTPIIQPGSIYGGFAPNDTIGTLHRFVPLRFVEGPNPPSNLSDCAIALLSRPNILAPEIAFIGKLACVKNPKLNGHVRKVGSTTELTDGIILSIGVTFTIFYLTGRQALFKDAIFTSQMVEKGDSGALLVDKNNCGVGMLFGKNGEMGVYARLSTILDQLDVKLVT